MRLGRPSSDKNQLSHPLPSLYTPSSTPPSGASASGSSGSDYFLTPPLTPDVDFIDYHVFPSPASSSSTQDIHGGTYVPATHRITTGFHHDEDTQHIQPHSLETKKGKKPERGVVRDHSFLVMTLCRIGFQCYDTLINNVPGSYKARFAAYVESQGRPISNDRDEWYGLEYALELSSWERCPCDTQSLSAGEHSKVRRPLLIIHYCYPYLAYLPMQYRAVNHRLRSIRAPSTRFLRMRTTISGRTGIDTLIDRMKGRSIRKGWNSRRNRRIWRGSMQTRSGQEMSCIDSRSYALEPRLLRNITNTHLDPGRIRRNHERRWRAFSDSR